MDSEYDASIAAWCNAAEENTHLNHVWNKTWIDYGPLTIRKKYLLFVKLFFF